MTPVEILADAWARWDESPRDSDRANRTEDACQVVAGEHALTTTELRAQLAEHRRAHRRATYQDALAAVLDLEGEPMDQAVHLPLSPGAMAGASLAGTDRMTHGRPVTADG